MVLADLGRKITSALRSLSNATVINEEVNPIFPPKYVAPSVQQYVSPGFLLCFFLLGFECYA